MGVFSATLKAKIDRTLGEVNSLAYKIANYCFVMAVLRSPSPENPGEYAKGVLANQWYPNDGPEFSAELTDERSPGGKDSLTRIGSVITGTTGKAFLKKDGVVTLANNVPYGILAEKVGWQAPPEGHWSGRVGPYRMIALAIQATLAKFQ